MQCINDGKIEGNTVICGNLHGEFEGTSFLPDGEKVFWEVYAKELQYVSFGVIFPDSGAKTTVNDILELSMSNKGEGSFGFALQPQTNVRKGHRLGCLVDLTNENSVRLVFYHNGTKLEPEIISTEKRSCFDKEYAIPNDHKVRPFLGVSGCKGKFSLNE